jgi:hypothetical protein
VDADPAQDRGRPKRIGKNPARERAMNITSRTDPATGVMSTAREEGNLRQWGRPGMVEESRTSNVIFRKTDHLGVGEGQRYR